MLEAEQEGRFSIFLPLKLFSFFHSTLSGLVRLHLDSKHAIFKRVVCKSLFENLSEKNWIKIIYCLLYFNTKATVPFFPLSKSFE